MGPTVESDTSHPHKSCGGHSGDPDSKCVMLIGGDGAFG